MCPLKQSHQGNHSTNHTHIQIQRRCRNQPSMAFQIPSVIKDAYKNSFFPRTIRDWNDLPGYLIPYSELSDDSLSKLTSLVRASD